jgi:hypothetical protein
MLVCTAGWWLHKSKHVAHCHNIETNKLIILSECEWVFEVVVLRRKRIKKFIIIIIIVVVVVIIIIIII